MNEKDYHSGADCPCCDEETNDSIIRKMLVETATTIEPQREFYVCILCRKRRVEFDGKVISNDCKCKEGAYLYTPLEEDE